MSMTIGTEKVCFDKAFVWTKGSKRIEVARGGKEKSRIIKTK